MHPVMDDDHFPRNLLPTPAFGNHRNPLSVAALDHGPGRDGKRLLPLKLCARLYPLVSHRRGRGVEHSSAQPYLPNERLAAPLMMWWVDWSAMIRVPPVAAASFAKAFPAHLPATVRRWREIKPETRCLCLEFSSVNFLVDCRINNLALVMNGWTCFIASPHTIFIVAHDE